MKYKCMYQDNKDWFLCLNEECKKHKYKLAPSNEQIEKKKMFMNKFKKNKEVSILDIEV